MSRASTMTPHTCIKPTLRISHTFADDFFCVGAADGSKGLILSNDFDMEVTAIQVIYTVTVTAGSFPSNCVQHDLSRNGTGSPFATLQQTVATLGWKRNGDEFSEVFAPGDELYVRSYGATTGAGPPLGNWQTQLLTVYVFCRRYVP